MSDDNPVTLAEVVEPNDVTITLRGAWWLLMARARLRELEAPTAEQRARARLIERELARRGTLPS